MPAEMDSSSLLAIGRYALAWTAAVALVALGAVSLLRAADGPRAVAAEPLELAAERGDCVLRRDAAGAAARNLDVMQPPTFGPPATPAAVVASLRRGMIVVHYRRGTPRGMVLALRRETGALSPTLSQVQSLANAQPVPPEPTPRESPAYIELLDANRDGVITPQEASAARFAAALDRFDPTLFFGEGRQIRLGVEVSF